MKPINKDVQFNIKTVKRASPQAEEYLSSVISEGEAKRDMFTKVVRGRSWQQSREPQL